MKLKLLSLALISTFAVSAQQVSYDLSTIPEALKEKAHTVVQVDKTDIYVESMEKTMTKVHQVYTIMNDEGKNGLIFFVESNPYRSVEDIDLKAYDAKGKQLVKLKKKDMLTQAVGESFIDDAYVIGTKITAPSYPVTIEVKYELKSKGTLFLPDFEPSSIGKAVLQTSYTVNVPDEVGLRYKAVDLDIQPMIKNDGNRKSYLWTAANLKALEREAGSANSNVLPHVKLAPNNFYYYGTKGSFTSWQQFGLWLKNMYTGLDELPAERKNYFAELVKNEKSEKDKIRKLYQYMQQNFRYISIQLGLGGLKPFSAEFTDNKKYGDCKALSNYMMAMLKSIGIKSHLAIIEASYNSKPVDPAFPSFQFNHVILCVPSASDSIWLECTSSTAEFGVLGTFTENRNTLLLTDDGGRLVWTPASKSSSNVLQKKTNIRLSQDMSATSATELKGSGSFGELIRQFESEKEDDQKLMLVYAFGLKKPDEFKIRIEGNSKRQMLLQTIHYKLPEFTSGNKWFISPWLTKAHTFKLPKTESRKNDYYFYEPFEKIDSVVFDIPDFAKIEVLPEEKRLSNSYAEYTTRYVHDEKEKKLYAIMTLKLFKHQVLAADYAMVKKFFDDVTADESKRIVLNITPVQKGF